MSDEHHGRAANREARPRALRGLATALVGAVAVGALVWVAAPGKVFDQLAEMNAAWALAAVVLEVGSCLCYVIVFRFFFPEPPAAISRRVAWVSMGAGAVLPGGNITSAATTGLLMRNDGLGTRQLLGRCAALLCLLTAFGFAVNGAAGALLFAGVPDGPLDLSHTGIPIVVSAVVLSGAAIVVLASRRFGERTPKPVRGRRGGPRGCLVGAQESRMAPVWRGRLLLPGRCGAVGGVRRDRSSVGVPRGVDRLLHRLSGDGHPDSRRSRRARCRSCWRAGPLRPPGDGLRRRRARVSRDRDLGAWTRRADRVVVDAEIASDQARGGQPDAARWATARGGGRARRLTASSPVSSCSSVNNRPISANLAHDGSCQPRSTTEAATTRRTSSVGFRRVGASGCRLGARGRIRAGPIGRGGVRPQRRRLVWHERSVSPRRLAHVDRASLGAPARSHDDLRADRG